MRARFGKAMSRFLSRRRRPQESRPTRFGRDERGVVAMIFALALVPLLGLVGAAIDYSRSTTVRARLQSALDAAVLAAAVVQGTDEDRRTAFAAAFNAHFLGSEISDPSALLDLTTPGVVKGEAGANVNMVVMKMFGAPTLSVAVKSEGRIPGGVEFMMVLDVSGSMKWADLSGRARIDVLREAATELVDTAVAEAPTASRLKFGYVPFTMNVNIGAANTAFVDGANDPLFTGTSWAGCVMERAPPNHFSTNFSPTAKYRAYIYPPETDNDLCDNPSAGANNVYKYVEQIDSTGTTTSPYTRGPNYNCVRHPVMPLTTDATAVKAGIASLTSEFNMGTLLAPGITWGMRLLTPNAPFPGADPSTSSTRKVMVMLTDGEQTTEMRYPDCNTTQNSSGTPYAFDPAALGLAGRRVGPSGPRDFFGPYGYIFDSDPFNVGFTSYGQVDPSLDPLALDACAAAKRQGIEVYSIAVSSAAGPGTTVHDTLRACATSAAHFFYAADEAALKNAFATVARNSARFVRTR